MQVPIHVVLGLLLLALGCSREPASDSDPDMSVPGGAGSGAAGASAAPPSTTAGAAGNAAPIAPGTGGMAAPVSPSAGSGGQPTTPAGDAGVVVDAAAPGAPARGTGPGDWVAGDYPPDLTAPNYLELTGVAGQGENVRQYKVHVPPSYDPAVPTPTVFCIHGLGQDALLFCVTGTAMDKQSDEAGFIMIMPNGYQNSWNAGTCCGAASTEQLDDVALFRALLEEVGKHVNIDLDRVYATGLSNGAYMSYRLACEAADMITGVVPVAGAIGKNDIGGGTNANSDFTSCEPSRPVSVLDMHGTADPLIPYSLKAPTLEHIAAKNGCAMTTKPATAPLSAGDTTCVSYEGCPSGIELTACTVEAGGHCWFGSPDCGTGGGAIGLAIVGANSDTLDSADAAVSFFARH